MTSSAALDALAHEASGCALCAQLVASRTRVVPGRGAADADVMFVVGAPDVEEDARGELLVGRAGELFDELLAAIGLAREDVFLTCAVRCRPADGRAPERGEAANCAPFLAREVELVAPRVVCALGGAAARLLRGDAAAVRRVRGTAEVRTLGTRAVRLLPLFHPGAALYAPGSVATLREDFAAIPALLALGPVPQPEAELEAVSEDGQLGLF